MIQVSLDRKRSLEARAARRGLYVRYWLPPGRRPAKWSRGSSITLGLPFYYYEERMFLLRALPVIWFNQWKIR